METVNPEARENQKDQYQSSKSKIPEISINLIQNNDIYELDESGYLKTDNLFIQDQNKLVDVYSDEEIVVESVEDQEFEQPLLP